MTDGPAPGMTSRRPYLLRAMYEWIADNGMTPHLLVDASRPGVRVPAFAVNDGKVVLNVADRAVGALDMGNDEISFTARFGGVSHQVRVPIGAVLLIYARETSQGMALPDEAVGASSAVAEVEEGLDADADGGDDGGDGGGSGSDRAPPPKRGGHLRVIK